MQIVRKIYIVDIVLKSEVVNLKEVELYIEGSCLGNPGVGSYCVIMHYKEHEKILQSDIETQTTNNRIELQALLTGLKNLNQSCTVTVYTENQNLVKSINNKWLYRWQQNSWKNSTGEVVKNHDLWVEIFECLRHHTVNMVWVKIPKKKSESVLENSNKVMMLKRCADLVQKQLKQSKNQGVIW